jgi:hypothetical protein
LFLGVLGPSEEPTNCKFVIPAKAGTHRSVPETVEKWLPAFAGTTIIFYNVATALT